MTHYLIFGLINVIVMALTVRTLLSRSKPMTVNIIQCQDVPKYIFLIAEKTPKLSSEGIEVVKQHQEPSLSPILQQDVTLNGIRDISGIALQWAVCSPTISLKALRLLPKLSKSGSLKTA